MRSDDTVNDQARPATVPLAVGQHEDDLLRAPTPSDKSPLRPGTAQPTLRRYNLMRFRHFSDTQLFTNAKLQQATTDSRSSDAPFPPAIITTAPTYKGDLGSSGKRPKLSGTLSLRRNPSDATRPDPNSAPSIRRLESESPSTSRPDSSSLLPWRRSTDQRRSAQPSPSRLSSVFTRDQHHSTSDLVSRTDARSVADSDATRPASSRVSNRRSLFFRSNKRKSLFPLPPKTQVVTPPHTAPVTPRASMSALSVADNQATQLSSLDGNIVSSHDQGREPGKHDSSRSRSAVSFAAPAFPLLRNASSHSAPSTRSPPSIATTSFRTTTRDRASTMSTFPRVSDDMTPPPTLSGSARNSMSTSGKTSLGGLLALGRFRHGSDTNGSRHASPGPNSKSNSFAISRELHPPPSRHDNESAATYLDRLRNIVSRGTIAATLSQSGDPFLQTVLRSYTRKLAFFGEPIDMSLRKFLLEAELPKETVHVDRVIQAFADRYHECNPGIFMSPGKDLGDENQR